MALSPNTVTDIDAKKTEKRVHRVPSIWTCLDLLTCVHSSGHPTEQSLIKSGSKACHC